MKRILYITSILIFCLHAQAEKRTDVPCGEWFTIKALAHPDYAFVKWSDGNTDSIRSIQVNEDAKYIAFFAAKCEEYANWPVVVLYDWLLGVNVTAINEMGYYISPTNVTWYRVVGEPDDMHNVFPLDDQVVATGYYLTLGHNLKGTGDYYAVVDVSDAQGRLCDGLMRTMIVSYSGKAKAPQIALMPSVARPGQMVKIIGLNPTEQTTIQVYSTAGQLLHTYECEDTQFFIPTESIAGCYHVRVSSPTINQTVKFIVQN